VRVGITLLPELAWEVDRGRWQAVETFGYDHAWTFDHLAWRSLADSPGSRPCRRSTTSPAAA
jgi:hypothetical protein